MAKISKLPVKSTSFKEDVIALASGTVVGQVLTILTAPFLGRLFNAEAFGIFALIMSIAGVLASVSSLQYEQAIVLPERDEDAANLLAGNLAILLMFGLSLFPVFWLIGPRLANWLNAPAILPYLWLVPVIVVFGGLGAGHPSITAWAARTRRFATISITRAAGSITTSFAKLAAGFAGFTSGGGLLVGSVSGSILSPVLLGWRLWREDRPLFLRSIQLHKIWQNLGRYRKFAIYNTPSALLGGLSYHVPQ
ncbi:MAG: lipopolysaccharide biosynthesis protein, partial [Anaerolineales bacterium]